MEKYEKYFLPSPSCLELSKVSEYWAMQGVRILDLCKVSEYWTYARCPNIGPTQGVRILDLCKVSEYWTYARCPNIGPMQGVRILDLCMVSKYWTYARCPNIYSEYGYTSWGCFCYLSFVYSLTSWRSDSVHLDKALFFQTKSVNIFSYFSYFSIKTYVVATH